MARHHHTSKKSAKAVAAGKGQSALPDGSSAGLIHLSSVLFSEMSVRDTPLIKLSNIRG